MSLRGTVSSALSPLSPASKNCMFCVSIVIKIVCSTRDIGLFRKPLLAQTEIFCGSKLVEKAVCIGEPAEKRWLLREQLNCWHRDRWWDWKLFFLLLPHGKKADESEGMGDAPFCLLRKLKGRDGLLVNCLTGRVSWCWRQRKAESSWKVGDEPVKAEKKTPPTKEGT